MSNLIASGFLGEESIIHNPSEFGNYRLLTDKAFIEDIKNGPRYIRACEWARGCRLPVEETAYYKTLIAELEQQTPNGIMLESKERIIEQFYGFRQLFEDIRDYGYQPCGYVYSIYNHHTEQIYYYGDINLRRVNGRLEFGDGRHRIAILLALKQPVYYIEVS